MTSDSKNPTNLFQKLLYSTISVLLTSTILNFLYVSFLTDHYMANTNFHALADANWTEALLSQIEEYLPDWKNACTPAVAMCRPVCSLNTGNGKKISYAPACQTFPVFFINEIVDEKNLSENVPFAEATLPCFLNLSQSKIPDANLGIFSLSKLSRGIIFGPYTGVIRSAYGEEGEKAKDGGYAWRIYRENEKGEDDDFFIDGLDDKDSNWLRYVNSARYEEEQNLYVLMFNQSVYYVTYKDVEPNQELLVWYGKAYADYLHISVIDGADHDWDSDYAPKMDIVVCDSCEKSKEAEFFDQQFYDNEEIEENSTDLENSVENSESPVEELRDSTEDRENPSKNRENPTENHENPAQTSEISKGNVENLEENNAHIVDSVENVENPTVPQQKNILNANFEAAANINANSGADSQKYKSEEANLAEHFQGTISEL